MELPSDSFIARFDRGFQSLAVVLFRTFVLFVVVNVAIGYFYTFRDKVEVHAAAARSNPKGQPRATALRDPWQMSHVDMEAFEGVKVEDAEQGLDDTVLLGRNGFIYEPWVESGPSTFSSKSVNVMMLDSREFMYRKSILDPATPVNDAAPPLVVYVFGGSTAFGWNGPDAWTVASYLWEGLQRKAGPGRKIEMYNFARPMYYSSQEMLLFERLLRAGHRPDVAIFLDGLNDTFQLQMGLDQPSLTPTLTAIMESEQVGKRGTGLREYQWVPIVRLAYSIRLSNSAQISSQAQVAPPPANKAADFVERTYLANVDLAQFLGQKYGVKCYCFWQPCPMVHYDLSLHRAPLPNDARNLEVYRRVYDAMRSGASKDVVYLGDIIDEWGKGRKVFIDDVHYGPAFTHFLVEKMLPHIDLPVSVAGR